MNKLLIFAIFCFSLSVIAQQPPQVKAVAAQTKAQATATVASKTEKKPEAKKAEDQKDVKQTSLVEDVIEFYKSSEKVRTELKNTALTYYNETTNSPYFQIGKCTVAGLLIYYGAKQFKSFTMPEQNARMGELEVGLGNPFAEARPLAIFKFLKSRENFKTWCKDPLTKAGVKILVGNVLLTKQIMEGVSLYQKAVKRFL